MIQLIPELRLGPTNNEDHKRVAFHELTDRLNRVIRALNGATAFIPDSPDALIGPPGPQGPPGPAGPPGTGGSSLSRTSVSIATASLAAGATEQGVVVVAKGAQLYTITADIACRVIFYSTAAARTADSGRPLGTPAPPGEGISAEFAFATAGTFYVDPTPMLKNLDTGTSNIYYAITNNTGAPSIVNVGITFLPVET